MIDDFYTKPSRLKQRNFVAHAHQETASGYGKHITHEKQKALSDLLYEEGLKELDDKEIEDYGQPEPGRSALR